MSTGVRHVAAFLLILAASGCVDSSDVVTTADVEPETTVSSVSTTQATTATSIAASTTMLARGEAPVIHLAGYTTVYSQDGEVFVSGWLDEPAAVTVGGDPVEMRDEPSGSVTFETVLDLDAGSHSITIVASNADGLESEVTLSVFVDPTLELEIGFIKEVDLVERTMVVDYVEFLTGDEANAAAIEDGVIGEEDELPGGFYVRDRSPALRTLALGDLEAVTLQACFPEEGPCVVEQSVDVDAWVELISTPELTLERYDWAWYGDASLPYWITLKDGIVVQLTEQYLP